MPGYRIRIDPEERETTALAHLAGGLSDAAVLEVGCGDGRLTWRYARQARSVLAIDGDAAAIDAARRAIPGDLNGRVAFERALIGELAAGPSSFDVAILAWSL